MQLSTKREIRFLLDSVKNALAQAELPVKRSRLSQALAQALNTSEYHLFNASDTTPIRFAVDTTHRWADILSANHHYSASNLLSVIDKSMHVVINSLHKESVEQKLTSHLTYEFSHWAFNEVSIDIEATAPQIEIQSLLDTAIPITLSENEIHSPQANAFVQILLHLGVTHYSVAMSYWVAAPQRWIHCLLTHFDANLEHSQALYLVNFIRSLPTYDVSDAADYDTENQVLNDLFRLVFGVLNKRLLAVLTEKQRQLLESITNVALSMDEDYGDEPSLSSRQLDNYLAHLKFKEDHGIWISEFIASKLNKDIKNIIAGNRLFIADGAIVDSRFVQAMEMHYPEIEVVETQGVEEMVYFASKFLTAETTAILPTLNGTDILNDLNTNAYETPTLFNLMKHYRCENWEQMIQTADLTDLDKLYTEPFYPDQPIIFSFRELNFIKSEQGRERLFRRFIDLMKMLPQNARKQMRFCDVNYRILELDAIWSETEKQTCMQCSLFSEQYRFMEDPERHSVQPVGMSRSLGLSTIFSSSDISGFVNAVDEYATETTKRGTHHPLDPKLLRIGNKINVERFSSALDTLGSRQFMLQFKLKPSLQLDFQVMIPYLVLLDRRLSDPVTVACFTPSFIYDNLFEITLTNMLLYEEDQLMQTNDWMRRSPDILFMMLFNTQQASENTDYAFACGHNVIVVNHENLEVRNTEIHYRDDNIVLFRNN